MLKLLCILLISLYGLVSSNKRKLEFVQTIFRHGHRAPRAHPYPNDKYNEIYWPRGWGEMTETGIHELVELGSFFRKRYGDLISTEFNSEQIFVQSSYMNRAKESAHLMLLGLYDGPVSRKVKGSILQKHAENKYAQLVTSGTEEQEDWIANQPFLNCPNAIKISNETLQKETELVENEFADVFALIRNVTGNPDITFSVFRYLEGWADIQKEIEQNLAQSNWVSKRWPNHQNRTTLEIGIDLVHRNLFLRLTKDDIYKYWGPYLLNDFIDNALLVSKKKQTKRFIAYSSHDIALIVLLHCFGYTERHIPEFASAVIVEVYSREENGKKVYELKMLFRECKNENPDKCPLKEAKFFDQCVYCSVELFADRYKNDVVKTVEEMHENCYSNSTQIPRICSNMNNVTLTELN